MTPDFYLILDSAEITDELSDSVFEAGFDDSTLTARHGKAAIWVRHRPGELSSVVREALLQARTGGLTVCHVELDSEVFA